MAYENERPYIPADTRREVMTEAGHRCTIQHCNEHIVEVHHIDENRENNNPENLVVLCDKHHKLAHQKIISRMDLRKYKELLRKPVAITNTTSSDHDRKLINKINNIFPYDVILLIKNEHFGSFVRKEVIFPFHELLNIAEDPLFKFTDQRLESIKENILNKAIKLMRHFAQQSAGRTDGYDYVNLNEIRARNPNADIKHWEKHSQDTVLLAQDFCTDMLALRAELINF